MDGFKNPFNEFEGDQIINLAEATSTQPKNPQKSKQAAKLTPKQPQQQQSDPMIKLTEQKKQEEARGPYDTEQTIFMNTKETYSSMGTTVYEQPPLFEDIGVDPELVADKMMSIIKFQKPLHRYVEDTDLFGPLLIAFMFGLLLMLSGKMHFGDIYALFVVGNLLSFLLFNLMSKKDPISLYTIMSILGYCLLPMLIVGLVGIFVALKNQVGIILSLGLSGWCAYTASDYLQMLLSTEQNDRKLLFAYPLYLYYVSFAMITIF